MNITLGSRNKQKGNILLIIIAFVAIIGFIAVYMMSGSGSSNTSANASAKVLASTIMNDMSAMSTTASTIAINQGQSATATIADTAAANAGNALNIYNTTAGTGMPVAVPPTNAFTTGNAYTYYLYAPAAFDGGTNSYPAVVALGVTKAVCQAVENSIYGDTNINNFTTTQTAATTAGTSTSATPMNANPIEAFSATKPKGGCFTTSDGVYLASYVVH